MADFIPTIYGPRPLSDAEADYINYLDDAAGDLPGGVSFGLLLFKADPTAFALGFTEWRDEQACSEAAS